MMDLSTSRERRVVRGIIKSMPDAIAAAQLKADEHGVNFYAFESVMDSPRFRVRAEVPPERGTAKRFVCVAPSAKFPGIEPPVVVSAVTFSDSELRDA